jgi:mono/diheme cytochrome c family protein
MYFLRKQFRFVSVIVALLFLAACGPANTPTPTVTAMDGSHLFATKGCAVCHGDQGQGDSGPAIVHHTEAQVLKQVREPSGVMPAFDRAALSDAELAAIASFVAELEGSDGHDEPDHGADHAH